MGAFLRVILLALLTVMPVLSHTCGGLKNYSRLYNQFSGEKVHSLCERSETWMKHALRGMKKQKVEMPHGAKYWMACFSACRSARCFDDIEICLSELKEKAKNSKNPNHNDAIDGFGFGPEFFINKTLSRKKRAIKESLDKLGRSESKKVIRKEVRRLSADERRRIFAAIDHLKNGPKIDKMSKMDILIVYHTPEYAPTAHFCPTFFPYHREYLKNFELATRLIEPDLGLPYWDTTLEEALPDPKDSIIWTDEFFGTGVGELVNGPFANWRPRPDPLSPALQHLQKLTRNVSENHLGALLKERDVQELLSKKAFREFDFCVDPFMELIHGSNHFWIGGHMSDTRVAPNDPVFFFLHSFFDLIWEQWRHKHQSREQRETEFVTDKGSCNPYCSTTNLLKPFAMKETDGLSNFYTDNLYEFEDRPTCSVWKPDCGSPYLFCDTRRYRCLSKVRKNGNCNGFDGTDICYKSLCVRGRCSAKALWNKTADDNLPISKKPTPFTVNPETPIEIRSQDFLGDFNNNPNPIIQNFGDDQNSDAGSAKTVWLPITVILQARGQNQAYPAARIITKDFRYNITLYGRHADSNDEPYVTGSAFARVLDPFAHRGPVEASIRVYGEMGDECSALCLNQNLLYEPCRAKLKLSIRPEESDDIPFTPNFNLAKYLNWMGRERSPDKFMFVCSKSSISITTTSKRPDVKEFPVMQSGHKNLSVEPPVISPASNAKRTTTTTKRHVLSTIRPASLSEQFNGPAPSIGSKNVKPLVFPSSLGFSLQNNQEKNGISASRTIIASGCLNTHICCKVWATKDECQRNQRLRRFCQRSCGLCIDNSNTAGQCVDNNVLCPTWAKENQCETNTFWMQENCRRSCQACNRTLSQLEVMCTAVKNCQNVHNHCDYWSIVNECAVNPKWMAENCPKACKKCLP